MQSVIFVAIAGALGAVGRYGIGSIITAALGKGFAFGTLLVNIIGCLLIGILMHISLTTEAIPHPWRTALTVGFLGAFTTFSTFSYETVKYIELGQLHTAAINIGTNVILGILATVTGLAIAKTILGASAA